MGTEIETNELKFNSLKEFYPYYLGEHKNKLSRRLHFIGTLGFICTILFATGTGKYSFLLMGPILGYGFAWVGHYFFEKNKPATFKFPLYSLASDFIMFYEILTGRIKF